MSLIISVALLGPSNAVDAQQREETAATIKYLVIPIVSQSMVKGFFGGLAEEVNRQTGKKIAFHFPSNYCQTIRHAMDSAQDYDVLYLPPHIAPMMMRQRGYAPFVVSNHSVKGIFAFRNEPRIKTGHFKIALAGRYATTSFMARQQIAQLLRRDTSTSDIHVDNVEFIYHGTHDKALVSFYKGNSDAVAIVDMIFNRSVNQFKNELISSVYSAGYPRVILLARPGLDPLTRQQITTAFTIPRGTLAKSDPFTVIDIRAIEPAEYQRLLQMPDVDIGECLASDKDLTKPFVFAP